MAKRKPNRGPRPDAAPREPRPPHGGSGHWLFGTHAVLAALANPQRRCQRLLLTAEAERALAGELAALLAAPSRPSPEVVGRGELDRLLPTAVHQGIALEVAPLEEPTLEEVLRQGAAASDAVLLVLDQVTDPHNVGAILRSAAAFGALGVVVTERHAPHASATLAKAASGALETIPLVRVGNLARALEEIKGAGFWCIGLAADAALIIAEARLDGRTALVLGAEGAGLRRLTRERCDLLVRIPLASAAIASLNVSNAAAVALYELARRTGS
ncbi:MAG TPA: 23S rRNA (guanosine(2251)-2'-O)-methyltransferase RlmB [Alphaproteobacteria bacterium]|nr:23S rRNA (guanosine(2251)-2'-O)-methyltransferase RlmB [Alphaproteobacteria bacterium]